MGEYAIGMNLFINNVDNMNKSSSQTLYQVVPLVKASFFQKLFKQSVEQNAVIELNNLLATKSIKSISLEEVIEIEHRYKLTLNDVFRLNLEEFYAVYLNYCLGHYPLSKECIEELEHLKVLLSLDDDCISK